MDPDQARQIVRPDLGTNCFQKWSADDKYREILPVENSASYQF